MQVGEECPCGGVLVNEVEVPADEQVAAYEYGGSAQSVYEKACHWSTPIPLLTRIMRAKSVQGNGLLPSLSEGERLSVPVYWSSRSERSIAMASAAISSRRLTGSSSMAATTMAVGWSTSCAPWGL